jgi:hypothetical protein
LVVVIRVLISVSKFEIPGDRCPVSLAGAAEAVPEQVNDASH